KPWGRELIPASCEPPRRSRYSSRPRTCDAAAPPEAGWSGRIRCRASACAFPFGDQFRVGDAVLEVRGEVSRLVETAGLPEAPLGLSVTDHVPAEVAAEVFVGVGDGQFGVRERARERLEDGERVRPCRL